MAKQTKIVGTRQFWLPLQAEQSENDAQIIHNEGYINISLHNVYYYSSGNLFQDIFGGRERITLKSELLYSYPGNQAGGQSIVAAAVQNVTTVEANKGTYVCQKRPLSTRIPAAADSIQLSVDITAVDDDNFDTVLGLLNDDKFQPALQLLPTAIGPIITITSLVKKAFTNKEEQRILDATYAGNISTRKDFPLIDQCLLTGYLIFIYEEGDHDKLKDIENDKLSIAGDKLQHNGTDVENTYIIYKVTTESLRGVNLQSPWYGKYSKALARLDQLHLVKDKTQQKVLLQEALVSYVEGNALLDEDGSYIISEADSIKDLYLSKINDKYNTLAAPADTQNEAIAISAGFADAIGAIASIGSNEVSTRTLNGQRYLEKLKLSELSADIV